MEKEKMTAYDKFVLAQKRMIVEEIDTNKTVEQEMPDEYRLYLEQQLRRSEPSSTKVLTMDEFFGGCNTHKDEAYQALSREEHETKSHSILRNIKFKKSGKILLGLYVIIMLALALIVIVKTTTSGPSVSADAANSSITESSKIEKMVEDEEPAENDDWFDKLCDSLKK